jgi:thioredoxin reductase (NADPH)
MLGGAACCPLCQAVFLTRATATEGAEAYTLAQETLVIIGSGLAGWTAAVYAARANLQPLVYEGNPTWEPNREVGILPLGQLNLATEVENFPTWPYADSEAFAAFSKSALPPERYDYLAHLYEGRGAHHGKRAVTGPELMQWARQQAVNFGARIVSDDIVRVDFSRRPFTLLTREGQTALALAVIIATGAAANHLDLPSLDRFRNKGVSAAPDSDGALPRFRGRQVVVLGGGDAALEDALYLTRFAARVFLLVARGDGGARWLNPARRKVILSDPKIEQRLGWTILEILGDEEDGVTGVRLRRPEGAPEELVCSGLFLAADFTRPNTAFLEGQLELDEKGYIRWIRPGRTFTSVEGVFAAGDVADPCYRQGVTAAGSGCMAALDAQRWLATGGFEP